MTKTNLTDKQDLARLLEEKERRFKYDQLSQYFPDTGQFRRELYEQHVKFMAAGKKFNQRAFVASNRSGKTVTGGYEMTLHLTGEYPDWWEGRRFKQAISAWAASVSNEATKNIMQELLCGQAGQMGTGLIPKEKIVRAVKKPGVADAIETVYVQHVSGDISALSFKAYEQGRETFQGTKKQVIWLDEEPRDPGIYSESLTRTAGGMGEEGMIYCTFTPLYGLSDVLLSFLPGGQFPEGGVSEENPHKFVTRVEWDDVPHLSEEWKEQTLATYSPHERDARTKGIPSLGAGAIYPYPEDTVIVEPFEIPVWWPRVYGLDVGWKRTAAIWGAIDRDSDQVYLYSEHYMGGEVPAIHASAIKSRGDWMWGAIDPRADTRSQTDGRRLVDLYYQEGLHLQNADNSRESGLYKVGQALESGQLKVFNTCRNWLSEYRIYRRDEKGKIVKKNDHLMDATRYLMMTGLDWADYNREGENDSRDYSSQEGRDSVTGY